MENKTIKYRYRVEVPDVLYNLAGFSPVFCDIDSADWDSLTWGRYGSGGDFSCRHLFVDDWRLEHLWRRHKQGLLKIIQSEIVTSPDFSIETNFPAPLVQYQIWRSSSLAQLWMSYGVNVVPVLQWGCSDTFHLCLAGISSESVVAVRGPQKGTEQEWIRGALFFKEYLRPSLVIHFGRRLEGVFDNVIFKPLRCKALSVA